MGHGIELFASYIKEAITIKEIQYVVAWRNLTNPNLFRSGLLVVLQEKLDMNRKRSNKSTLQSSSGDNIDFLSCVVFHSPSVALHKIYDSIIESLFLYEEFYRCVVLLSMTRVLIQLKGFIEITNKERFLRL